MLFIVTVKYRAQTAFHVGMGFCAQRVIRHSRYPKKDVLSSSSRYRKRQRQHVVGAEKRPIANTPTTAAELQASSKGQMRRGDQHESYQHRGRTHRQGTAGGYRDAGRPGELPQERGMCRIGPT